MCAPFDNQLLPFGSCGSSFCHAEVYSAWLSQLTSSASSWKAPPHATPTPSARTAHSATFPSVSNRPHAFGFFFATSCVLSSPFFTYHATFSSSSLLTFPSPPARQAYVHSASLGRRYLCPVIF